MEETAELKKYLRKLLDSIENDAVFIFGNISLVETKRLDDIFCCIEVSWPEEYKNYIKQQGGILLTCPKLYKQIKQATKNKFFFSSNYCVVRRKQAISLIRVLISSINNDMSLIRAKS